MAYYEDGRAIAICLFVFTRRNTFNSFFVYFPCILAADKRFFFRVSLRPTLKLLYVHYQQFESRLLC